MQTFLPYDDFVASARALDYRRLGKQRVEAMQLLDAILGRPTKTGKPRTGWVNHPAAVMWREHPDALKLYHNIMIKEWMTRGYKNTMRFEFVFPYEVVMPSWIGNPDFHASHRSNLLRKDPKFYSQYGWQESPDLPYVWPK